ncbi:hypothetical protein BAUCODRAFT_152577 [Baudoinia panamericana UAMH 10762]|uniref:Carrier domain-containing protein n=1 Tax=Baudoinia panamericana (strain UAMH 10762) TaxID=717646 RepID=M2MXC1_BAUPA|nr:uncharacterized protein BAUCODRAFT_152577 [Baudoinia panamericana UAMH 10762]EMC91304.1 hypothetical protein BAUCODRAFT_152577 [Baudoinia panamericana UAMH 10762]
MEPNYFTCTLGQAAALGIQQPHNTINKLVDALSERHADQPAVGFPQPGDSVEDPWTNLLFSFADIKLGSTYVANLLVQHHETTLARCQTVGLLCPSTAEFLFTWLALIRLGHGVLLIAPQCQPEAIANLCKTCDVRLLFYDNVYADQAVEAARISSDQSGTALASAALPFSDKPQRNTFVPERVEQYNMPIVSESDEEVAYLHHTSGTSSGMPKPIPQTHRGGVGVLPSFSDGWQATTFTTTPLYHGGIADLFRAWTSHAMIWLFPGKRVPITAKNIIKCLELAKREHHAGSTSHVAPVKFFSSVPYVLQMLESEPEGLRHLQQMDIVGVGGAALPPEVGNQLVSNGVNLISRFGSAECGFLLSSHRDYSKDREWQYLRVASGAERYLRFEPQTDGGGLSELIVLKGWPHMAKRNRDNGSYATSDLFAPHPSIPNAWKYHSRADSQLTLITGKKFDPAPLEASLATSELVDDVLIFGNGQPYPGALVFRSQHAIGLSNADLLQQVWPRMEKLNAGSQDHARIAKAMLLPMPVLERPLEKSSKGTILRNAVEKRFKQEIESAYSQAEGTEDAANVPDESLPDFIRETVSAVVAKPGKLTDTTDLFSYGVDSVAGMRIRTKLRRLLPADSAPLPINVVEDCGSIDKLAQYVRRKRHGETHCNGDAKEDEHAYMRELVETYSRFVESIEATSGSNGQSSGGDVVVLTGATGALGAHVLNQYRKKPEVRKVYCLVRGSDEHAAFERVNKALTQRKLPALDGAKQECKVQIVQASLGENRLGLSDETYQSIAKEATVIMHVAWSVNFRMRLRSFVKDNIAGVTNLINLALASPHDQAPVFAFCSSVASAMAYSGKAAVPETIINDPSAATNLGYSQSKWVAEQICLRASETRRLKGRVAVFRVGQLAGDSETGVWNTKEAWPMMLSASKITESLPTLKNENLDWLPVDIAASALIQGAQTPRYDRTLAVYHVLNNNGRPTWMEMLEWLKQHESFNIVPPSRWVSQLEAAVDQGSTHPATQLLDHWREAYTATKQNEAPHAEFDMIETKEALPVLASVEPVDEEYFNKLWAWIKVNV